MRSRALEGPVIAPETTGFCTARSSRFIYFADVRRNLHASYRARPQDRISLIGAGQRASRERIHTSRLTSATSTNATRPERKQAKSLLGHHREARDLEDQPSLF